MTLPDTLPYLSLPTDRIGLPPPHHTVSEGVQLGTVTLQVADVDRSLDFYTRVIGFSLHRRTDHGGHRQAKLGLDGGPVLLILHEKPGVRPAPHRGRLGLYHFALLLPSQGDLGRFLRHALTQGVHVGQSDHHFSEATYLQDPDGISIEVYRDRPRSDWRVTPNGEIVGGGDPLDSAALNAAAGALPWHGLPDGTTFGHLHFYVGDLEGAARFYHAGLGFPKTTWNFPGALFLGVGGYHHHLGLNTWAAGSAPSGDDDARLLTWELILPDQQSVERTKQSLMQAGFPVASTPAGLLATDPWGIAVRLRTA